jgi:hypothetical protein
MQKVNLLDKPPPEDNVFVQMNSENKFIGELMWKVFDFVTLGTFEDNMSAPSK